MSAEGLGNYFSQLGTLALENIQAEPPTDNGGSDIDTLYVNKVPLLRDRDAINHPLVVGADGAGVYGIALADSPYDIPEDARVLLVDTSDGAVTANLPADGGPFDGRPLVVMDAASNFGTNAFTLDGNGKTISGAATVVMSTDNGTLSVAYGGSEWLILGATGTVAGLPAHASTHLAGGPDPLLSSPGVFGGTTPNIVNTSQAYLTGTAATAVANKVSLTRASASTGLVMTASGAQVRTFEADAISATLVTRDRLFATQIANNATYDVVLGGTGGFFVISAVGATGASGCAGAVANNGTPNFRGLTFTGYSTTAATPVSVNVFASGGNLRIENLSGGALNFLIELKQLVSL